MLVLACRYDDKQNRESKIKDLEEIIVLMKVNSKTNKDDLNRLNKKKWVHCRMCG
jgi:hypothetical protein